MVYFTYKHDNAESRNHQVEQNADQKQTEAA